MKRKHLFWIVVAILIFTGCSNKNEKQNKNESNEQDEASVIFRNIDITIDEDQINIDGEVKSWNGSFFYHLLQGEEVVIEEEEIKSKHIGFWTPFIIQLNKEDLKELSDDVPHIVLYGKNKEKKEINPNYVPIDLGE